MMDLRGKLQSSPGGSYILERELSGGGMSRVFVANLAELSFKRRNAIRYDSRFQALAKRVSPR